MKGLNSLLPPVLGLEQARQGPLWKAVQCDRKRMLEWDRPGSNLICDTWWLCDHRWAISVLWASVSSILNSGVIIPIFPGQAISILNNVCYTADSESFWVGRSCRFLGCFSVCRERSLLNWKWQLWAGISLPGTSCQMSVWWAVANERRQILGEGCLMGSCGILCDLTWKGFYWILTMSQTLCWCLNTYLICG